MGTRKPHDYRILGYFGVTGRIVSTAKSARYRLGSLELPRQHRGFAPSARQSAVR